MSAREYHQLIFSKHAWERLRLRSLDPELIAQTISKPDRTVPGVKPETAKFVRRLNGRQIHAVATYLPQKKRWLVISVWVRGEDDPIPLTWKIIATPFKFLWWMVAIIGRALVGQFKK